MVVLHGGECVGQQKLQWVVAQAFTSISTDSGTLY